jgi:hypothetical protein
MSLELLLLQVAIAYGLCVAVVCSCRGAPSAPGSPLRALSLGLGIHLFAAGVVILSTGHWHSPGLGAAGGALGFLALLPRLRGFTAVGRLLLTTQVELIVVGTIWGIVYMVSLPVSTATFVLLLGGLPLTLLCLPLALLGMIPQWDVLCRYEWRRPRGSLDRRLRGASPKVSLHVPICSEPPEIVIATLEALARLE